MPTGKQILSDEVRRTWRETLNEVEHRGTHVTVLRYQTPTAVIVPVGWYEAAVAAMEASA
jgi:PHD/YefM family antitoxin component YafN of YafNO toxin-antitoxin module